MQPVFRIGNHDWTQYIADDGLQPVRNDIDSANSGRNLTNGLMYRTRVSQKDKWIVSFLRLPEVIMKAIAEDIDPAYVDVTMLDPKTNTLKSKTYYVSTLTYGAQRYDKNMGITYYDGVTFDMIER